MSLTENVQLGKGATKTIKFNPKSPAIICSACLFLAKETDSINFQSDPEQKLFMLKYCPKEGNTIDADDVSLAKYICSQFENCSLFNVVPANFGDSELVFQAELEGWLHFAINLEELVVVHNSGRLRLKPFLDAILEKMTQLDSHLSKNMFLIGYTITLADIAVYGTLLKIIRCFEQEKFSEALQETLGSKRCSTENKLHQFNKWWLHLASAIPISDHLKLQEESSFHILQDLGNELLSRSVKEVDTLGSKSYHIKERVGSLSLKYGTANGNKANYEGKLKNAEIGKVVTRFPPEPSGYLHIGHAKAALLNAFYARQYNGKLILRFDDTNPCRESEEFEQSIRTDVSLLNITPDQITRTSDYFDKLEALCEENIRKGKFYLDDTNVEEMRKQRNEGKESPCRNMSESQNLFFWNKMKLGVPKGELFCVRAKIDMQSKNKCLRDPVMYRCITGVPHHVHGVRYKVYPTYDFACPVVDSIEGVTHALRTNEYADRIPQYQWVLETCGLRKVDIYEFSRLNFVHTVLSKRKLQWFIDNGLVESWFDPRFPTVRGIKRRGLQIDALLEFILDQGPSKNVNLMEWDKLWSINKKYLDPKVPRYMAVDANSCVNVEILNFSAVYGKDFVLQPRALHPKNPAVGQGFTVLTPNIRLEKEDIQTLQAGEEFTLINVGNAVVQEIIVSKGNDGSGQRTKVNVNLDLLGDFRKTKQKVHWVPIVSSSWHTNEGKKISNVELVLREYDHLIKSRKVEKNDNIEEIYNKNSVFDTLVLTDSFISSVSIGHSIQFLRRGYYIYDKDEKGRPVFIKIPDGKMKDMSVVKSQICPSKFMSRG